jgi:protein-tyrosine phosphatase
MPSFSSYYPAKQIIPNLWVGSQGDSENEKFMKRNNIYLVVNASRNIPMSFSDKIMSYRVPVHDHPDENETMARHIPIVVQTIDNVLRYGRGVLVHCRAGMQRSATVVAAYLMWKYGMTKNDAIQFMQRVKSETFQPKPTFNRALRDWDVQKTQYPSPQPFSPSPNGGTSLDVGPF